MSIIYWLFIEHSWIGGIWRLGRFTDLLQLDILIAILWIYNHKRWRRLIKLDWEAKTRSEVS